MTGELPFTVNDLLAVAGMCNVSPAIFFDGVDVTTPPAGSEGRRGLLRARRDSNPQPSVWKSIDRPESGAVVIDITDRIPHNPGTPELGGGAVADVITLPTWRNRPSVIREAVAR